MLDLMNARVDRRRWRGPPGNNRRPARWLGWRRAPLAAGQEQGTDNTRCHARPSRSHRAARSMSADGHGDTLGQLAQGRAISVGTLLLRYPLNAQGALAVIHR